MPNKNLFPQGHAVGKAFCNRKNEREQLKNSFLNNEHTVLVAPRRYGKSSLIKQVFIDLKIPGKRIDLFPATNIYFIYKAIKLCVSELLNEISPKTERSKQSLLNFIKKLHPKLTLNLLGQYLEITSQQTPEVSIIDLLVGLNTAAEKLKKRVVICFDEFQQVGLLKNHHSIEASIRHAAESSTYVTYIFSGSSRHLLSQMFNTKSRPLYHLCNLVRLERIQEKTYLDILYKRAVNRWATDINKKVIEEILLLTKCHSYYVNALCRSVWKKKTKPTISIVQKLWLDYIEAQSAWISNDLSHLTPNQKNILAGIAYGNVTEPSGQEFSEKVKISVSSIKKSLDILLRDDIVYKDKSGQYRVLDPALKTYLHRIKYFDFMEQ